MISLPGFSTKPQDPSVNLSGWSTDCSPLTLCLCIALPRYARCHVDLTGAICRFQSLAAAMKYLCAYPEYIEPLREEVKSVTDEDGWTKNSMVKLRRMDSFIREMPRVDPGS